MTQFTSFVAVEEMIVTDGGEPRKIEVPVEMPEGVSHEGVVGEEQDHFARQAVSTMYLSAGVARGGGGGGGRAVPTPPSKGQAPAMSVPSAPQPKARAKKDSGAGSAGGMGSYRGGGMGAGSGGGVGSGLGIDGAFGVTRPLSPEEQKRREILAKLNPSIAAVIERLKNKNSQPTADESSFVRNGKAELQVWLSDKSPEVLAQLKQLGFEVVLDPKTAKMIIGRLPIEKLAALVELKLVRYVAPMTTTN